MEYFPKPGSPAEILGHHVLLGRGPRVDTASILEAVPASAAVEKPLGPSAKARPEPEPQLLLARLAALTPGERTEALVEFVRGHVAGVLRLSPAKAPRRNQRLVDIGVDSLMAVELAGRLSAGLGRGRSLRSTLIFDHPTIQAIAEYIERSMLDFPAVAGNHKVEEETPHSAPVRGENLAGLSEEEVEQLLLAKLKEIKQQR
jgi:acyl carrier protein